MKKYAASKTNKLNEKLKQDISITELLELNSKDFLDVPLNRYLKVLIQQKGFTKARLIRDSGINRRFFFDILSGKRKPSRNYVLRFVLALQMPLKNIQWLLRATGYAQLYARDKRDSVIIYCINHKNSVKECNAILEKLSFELV